MIESVRYRVSLDESNAELIVAADPNLKGRMDKEGEYATHLFLVM